MTRIERFGWKGTPEPGIGRVVSAHGDYYHLVCNEAEGEILARKKKSVFSYRKGVASQREANLVNVQRSTFNDRLSTPITGDFVRFRHNDRGDSMITEVLPRFSHFERKDPTARRQAQTLAVNFDVLFVMMSLNENFSTARIERYLDLAEDIGEAEVKVVLTKIDLREPGDEEFIKALEETVGDRAGIVQISSLTGEGMDEIRRIVAPGRTVAFIGSSGVGKSTLVNTLAGEEWVATQEIQEWSGKGRHTTTSRELIMLPNGAMVVDTPGIREIGRVGEIDDIQVKGEATHRFRRNAGEEPSLVVTQDGSVVRSLFGRGIRPVVELYEREPFLLEDAEIYDRIVGRAAAAFYVKARVRSVTAKVMSDGAAEMLTAAGIAVEAGEKVPRIINREGTAMCPMETLVAKETELDRIIELISQAIRQ